MKKHGIVAFFVVLVILILCCFTTGASSGDSVSQDGISVSVSADKTDYKSDDKINLSFTVKNNLDYEVYGLKTEILIPTEFSFVSDSGAEENIEILSGEEYTKTVTLSKAKENKSFLIYIVIGAVLLAGGIFCTIFFLSRKNAKSAVCILLCCTLAFALVPINTDAAEKTKTLTLKKDISVLGKTYTIDFLLKYPEEAISPDCTLHFETGNDKKVDSVTVKKGSTVEEFELESTDTLLFAGWCTNNDFKEKFDFSKPITRSTTAYAYWLDPADKTDTDKDGLADNLEIFYGTDPAAADTDKDGLNDFIEVVALGYNPLDVDTDANGIKDGDEDFDGDKIINVKEIELNIDPASIDSDNDLLNDYEEINTHKTNPSLSDTDSDGADDKWEIDNKFDPLKKISSFKVEINSVDVENNGVGASLSVDAKGDVASSVRIESVNEKINPLLSSSIPGYMGPAYEISHKGELKNATLSFHYAKSQGKISEKFKPTIYSLNEEKGTLTELEDQTLTEGKVSVKISGAKKCILLNKVAFDEVWENEIRPPMEEGEEPKSLDMALLIDRSGSMGPQGANNDPNNIRLEVSKQLVDKTTDKDRTAVISFGTGASILTSFTSDRKKIYDAIDSVGNTDTDTHINAALREGFDLFDIADNPDAVKYMVLLTDGKASDGVVGYDEDAKSRDIVIFTIGLGHSLDEELLIDIATSTGGKYYHATMAAELYDIYEQIEKETIDYTTDSNDDGIFDYYNDLIASGTLLLSNGSSQFAGIDFNYDKNGEKCADFDGDGIINGKELLITVSGDVVYMVMKSNPLEADSDFDGILDAVDNNPLVWNVSYRDLALLSNAVYYDIAAGTKLDEANIRLSIKDVGDCGSSAELKGWVVLESVYNPITGFEAAAYAKDNNLVIATRGSEAKNLADIVQDWMYADIIGYVSGLNFQLPAMETFIKRVSDRYADYYDNIYVTGHSLGGYLAIMASSQLVKHGHKDSIRSVVTFNGLGMSNMGVIGALLDIDDHVNFNKIKAKIINFRTTYDVVSLIGHSPSGDYTIPGAKALDGKNAHGLQNFADRFSNELRKPSYAISKYHGLNNEIK